MNDDVEARVWAAKRILELETERDADREANKNLQTALVKVRGERDELKADNERLTKERAAYKFEADRLDAMVGRLKAEVATVTKSFEDGAAKWKQNAVELAARAETAEAECKRLPTSTRKGGAMSEIKPKYVLGGEPMCAEECPEHNGPGLGPPPTCTGHNPCVPWLRARIADLEAQLANKAQEAHDLRYPGVTLLGTAQARVRELEAQIEGVRTAHRIEPQDGDLPAVEVLKAWHRVKDALATPGPPSPAGGETESHDHDPDYDCACPQCTGTDDPLLPDGEMGGEG